MINILIIAHAEIAMGYINCLEHIFSKKIDNLSILPISYVNKIDGAIDEAQLVIKKLYQDGVNQVLILSDIFGATPANIATRLLKPGEVELITGLNLPMLIKAVSYSELDLELCIKKTIEGARDSIMQVAPMKDTA